MPRVCWVFKQLLLFAFGKKTEDIIYDNKIYNNNLVSWKPHRIMNFKLKQLPYYEIIIHTETYIHEIRILYIYYNADIISDICCDAHLAGSMR